MPICESESVECGGRGQKKKKKKIAATPVEVFTYKLNLVKYISMHKRQTNQVFG